MWFALALSAFTAAPSFASRHAPECASFTPSDLSAYNATLLNVTHYVKGAKNVTGTLNKINFCEIEASVSYGSNSSLIFALWLPETQYASRFMAVGNGGMAGVIDYSNMLNQLNSGFGFAVAGGNAGHLASENNKGGGAPGVYLPYLHETEEVVAWIHDAISLFTPVAKAIVKEYYGHEAKYAYYNGCSTGGAQGFALAQFHPTLFDGIAAGSPGNWYSHLALSFLWNAQQTNTNATRLSQRVLDFITTEALKECDTIDGVPDNVIENPLVPTAAVTCLTQSQLHAANAIYGGPVRSDSPGTSLYPGFSVGSESNWMLQEGQLASDFSIPILQSLVFNNLSYDSATFNWASDVNAVDERAGRHIDGISDDLSNFRRSGAKMLVYQGWADPYNAALWPIQHLEAITSSTIGKKAMLKDNDFMKLFMIPGWGHCGPSAQYPSAPGSPAVIPALVDWVEKREVPAAGIKNEKPSDGSPRTRRLCSWPTVAKLRDGGEMDDWENYVCQ